MSKISNNSTNIPALWKDMFSDFIDLFSDINEICFFETDNNGLLSSHIRPRIEIFGYTQRDVENGLNVIQLFIPEEHEAVMSRLQKPLNKVTQADREYTGLRKDGSTFPMQIYSKPIIKNSKMIGRRGVAIDITEQKEVEKKLEESNKKLSDKNKEMEDFMATMAHDLKSPLTAISGFAELVFLEENELNPPMEHYLRRIQKNTEKIAMIVDDILDYSKLGAIEENKSDCKLNEILDEIILEYQPKISEMGVKVNIESNLPNINGIHNQIFRLFINLIDNAIKYMGSETKQKDIFIGVYEISAEFVTLYIKDTGIGIAEPDIPKLFKVFTRIAHPAAKNVSGSGIGLAHVKKIIEIHEGSIWVKSKEKEGTTFYFTLPVFTN